MSEYIPAGKEVDYNVPCGEIPDRPDKLFVDDQLESALDNIVPDNIDVDVNHRFSSTIARGTYSLSGKLEEIEVSWKAFEECDHYGGDGWVVVVSAVNSLVD